MGFWKNLRADSATGQLSQAVAESRLASAFARGDFIEAVLPADTTLNAMVNTDVLFITLPLGLWQINAGATVTGMAAGNCDMSVTPVAGPGTGAVAAVGLFAGQRAAAIRVGAVGVGASASVSPLFAVTTAGDIALRLNAGVMQTAKTTTVLTSAARATAIVAVRVR